MGGFKNESYNTIFEQNLFNLIILHISQCCKAMKSDCHETKNLLPNHEDKISNRLVACYLNTSIKGVKFTRENPEGFDADTDKFTGRTDIRIVSSDWLNGNNEAYYTIEAKRIDGNPRLNQEYISEGVSRFLTPSPPKYSSYYGKNIMLGYVVQAIDISENAEQVDKLQRNLLVDFTIGDMELACEDGRGFSRYQCLYQAHGDLNVELTHLFYDFSDVIA